MQFSWLRAKGVDGDRVISTEVVGGGWALRFSAGSQRVLPEAEIGIIRPRPHVPLICGPITQVEVVLDTVGGDADLPGSVTEVLLRGDAGSTLLIAAEADSRNSWHRYDESVVVLTGVDAADALSWVPKRQQWKPMAGAPRELMFRR